MACDPQAVGCWTTGPCCDANGARGTNREDYSHRQRYLVKQSNDVIVTRPGRLASKTPELRRMTRWCKLLVLSTHSSVKSNQHDGSQLSNRRIDRRRAPLRKRPQHGAARGARSRVAGRSRRIVLGRHQSVPQVWWLRCVHGLLVYFSTLQSPLPAPLPSESGGRRCHQHRVPALVASIFGACAPPAPMHQQ